MHLKYLKLSEFPSLTELLTAISRNLTANLASQPSLEDLKLKKEEIDLLIARAEFYRKRRLLEQRVDIFTEMFRKELIDASTFETKLKELGLSTENVNLIVALEKAKKGIAS
jgi:hypothetical protein